MLTNPEHYAHRSFAVRVSDLDESKRTVYGTVVPYDAPTMVDDGMGPYREAFAPGAFERSISQRGNKIKLFAQHDRRKFPIGIAAEWHDGPDALRGAFRVSGTTDGNDALTLISDGVVESFSVGFRSVKHETRGDTVYRTEAHLIEVSLVDSPAYAGAVVEGVRSLTDPNEVDEWLAQVPDNIRAALAARLAPAAPGTGDDPADPRTVTTMTAVDAYLRVRQFEGTP